MFGLYRGYLGLHRVKGISNRGGYIPAEGI